MKRVSLTPVLTVLLAVGVGFLSYRWEAHSAGYCQSRFPAVRAFVVLVGSATLLTSIAAILEGKRWRALIALAVVGAVFAIAAYLIGVFWFAGTQRQCFS